MVETTRLVGSETAVIASGGLALVSERQFDRRSQATTELWKGKALSTLSKQQHKKARLLACFAMVVETTRLELVTSTMSTWRSNQLGYASITVIILQQILEIDKHFLTT